MRYGTENGPERKVAVLRVVEQEQQELDRRLPVHPGNKELQDDPYRNIEKAEERVNEFQRTAKNIGKLHDNIEIKSIRTKLQLIEHPIIPHFALFHQEAKTLQRHRAPQTQIEEKHHHDGVRIRVTQQTPDQHPAVL
jgi:hypothetical protein